MKVCNYYPFGMPMPSRNTINNKYRYAYQGKGGALKKQLGTVFSERASWRVGDPETGKEAFELRLWDSRIGRWLTVDPKGEFSSPYLGMGNNPIRRIDPDGGSTNDFVKDKSGNIYDDKSVTSVAQAEAKGLEYIGPEISDVTNYLLNGLQDRFARDAKQRAEMKDYLSRTGAINENNIFFDLLTLRTVAKGGANILGFTNKAKAGGAFGASKTSTNFTQKAISMGFSTELGTVVRHKAPFFARLHRAAGQAFNLKRPSMKLFNTSEAVTVGRQMLHNEYLKVISNSVVGGASTINDFSNGR